MSTGANLQSQIDVLAGALINEHINSYSNLDDVKKFLSSDGTTTGTYLGKTTYGDYSTSSSNDLHLDGVIKKHVNELALQHVDVKFYEDSKLGQVDGTINDDTSEHYSGDATIALCGVNDEDPEGSRVPFKVGNDPVRLYNAALSDLSRFKISETINGKPMYYTISLDGVGTSDIAPTAISGVSRSFTIIRGSGTTPTKVSDTKFE